MVTPRSVVIVDDDWIIAEDMRRILSSRGYRVVAVASSPGEAQSLVHAARPDLVMIDARLGEGHEGLELAHELATCAGVASAVLLVTAHSDSETIRRAAAARVRGIVLKPFTERQLIAAVELALARPSEPGRGSEAPPSPNAATRRRLALVEQTLRRVSAALLDAGLAEQSEAGEAEGARSGVVTVPGNELSRREWEVIRALVELRRVHKVARALSISEHTVRNHLKSIFGKLGVHSQDELIDLVQGERSKPRL